MRLLVTGGAGFIGSNFVKMAYKNHRNVIITVLDALTYAGNLENFPPELWNNKNFSFCRGNILDKHLVFKLIHQADCVVHFASYTHIDRSIDLSDPFIDTDFKGTQVLLEAIRKYPVERFIHISTSEVYGSAQYVPMDESHPIVPQSPYAAAKAGADRLAYAYHLTYNLPIVIIRPFNTYGPNQYPEKLIPFFITNAIENKPLPVYGDGKNSRDWLYVDDCVKGIWAAIEANIKDVQGEIINLGTEKDVDVLTIAQNILKDLDRLPSLIEFVRDRPGHVKRLVASYKKASSLLGWTPTVSFEEGLKKTIDWYNTSKGWWKKIKRKKEFREFEGRWYGYLRRKA
ncbi:MAG TPA: dTDP-glucose 4,6-dehydratase [bacterium (Candidatus Stahlbacteria)]|nr:dTDP-glucose 4,6-dehydratase [Candidatus Stahlbacteria bacterium]